MIKRLLASVSIVAMVSVIGSTPSYADNRNIKNVAQKVYGQESYHKIPYDMRILFERYEKLPEADKEKFEKIYKKIRSVEKRQYEKEKWEITKQQLKKIFSKILDKTLEYSIPLIVLALAGIGFYYTAPFMVYE